MPYGVCENTDTAIAENLLSRGVAEGCVRKRDVSQDKALTYDDVKVPRGTIN